MGDDASSFPLRRKSAACEYEHQRFILKKKSYDQQYSHMYVSRLRVLEPVIRAHVEKGGLPILPKIIDLKPGDPCVIIGTIFKSLAKKPNILDEFVADEVLVLQEASTCLASDDDELVLEDESGRIALYGDIRVQEVVTGVVVGLQGEMRPGGDGFHVSRVFTPGIPPQSTLPARSDDAYVALVSGIQMGSEACDPVKTSLMIDYLAGRIGNADEKKFVQSIVRTIVIGNTLGKSTKDNSLPKASATAIAQPLEHIDALLSTLTTTMPVDIMPGAFDPSNFTLPQQPLATCLFPRSMYTTACHVITNPCQLSVDQVRFFGTSGQNIDSIGMCCTGLSPIQGLSAMLDWRHLAPTAPDILACYPMPQEDLFVIEEAPHVFFAGNQPQFESHVVEGENKQSIRVVCVPSFAETGVVVLVNLRDLSCLPLTFQ
ncbi:DNA polymerase delta subunit 2 [Aphanomyces cochlioides]|nr:DNA polymerase delta subunit 2 [Aphanomyces cochlioides]